MNQERGEVGWLMDVSYREQMRQHKEEGRKSPWRGGLFIAAHTGPRQEKWPLTSPVPWQTRRLF